ncbi:antirepressor [Xenorhabdus beddingii]|uniref:Antirepressor n=1 Tax=Xenorhabdus beddingii TaxID=40578 RepID=A0A1Y2SQG5_9GAMM|nr:antirepressor [Xenorhabdus beddingii]
MNIANSNLPVIAGVEITTDAEGRFNLNALHKASGAGESKEPNRWLRSKQAQELIAELPTNLAVGQEALKVQKGGTTPGTFAHELLAVSYAGWISPAFQLQVNQTFIDYRTGKLAPVSPEKSKSGLPEYRRARTLKMSVDAISNLFDLMPNLSNEAKQCAAANIVNPIVGFEAVPLPVLEERYYTTTPLVRWVACWKCQPTRLDALPTRTTSKMNNTESSFWTNQRTQINKSKHSVITRMESKRSDI